MSEFDKCIEIVLKFEGVLSDDIVDRGGLTKYGISQAAYPDLDIKNLTLEEAKKIYMKDYWHKAKCHMLPWPVNLVFLDYAVNSGFGHLKNAIIMLQKHLNQTPDGILGPKTLASIQLSDPKKICKLVLRHRLNFLCDIVKRNPNQRKFLKGWMNRIFDLHNIVNG